MEKRNEDGRVAFGRRVLFSEPPKEDDGRSWKKVKLPNGKFKIVRK